MIHSLRTFFRSLVKSSADPHYYRDVVAAPTSFSWKYFFFFNALAALITGISILVPLALLDVSHIIRTTAEVYPAELEIAATDQGLEINKSLPYAVPFPEWDGAEIPMEMVVFADQDQISGLDDVRALNAWAVVTQREAYIFEDEDFNEIRVYSLPEFEENWQVNRSTVDDLVNTLTNNSFVQQKLYVPLVGAILLLLLYPMILIMRFFVLALFSLITWVLTLLFMKDRGLSYGKIFQLSIHSITPVVIIAYILGVVGWFLFHGWPYMVAYLAWTLFVISKLPVTNTTARASASPARPKISGTKTKARKSAAKK